MPLRKGAYSQGADGVPGDAQEEVRKQARRSSSPETLPALVIPVQGTPPVPRAPPASAGSDAIPGHDRRPYSKYAWEDTAHLVILWGSRHIVALLRTVIPRALLAALVVGNISSSDLDMHNRWARIPSLCAVPDRRRSTQSWGREGNGGGTTARLPSFARPKQNDLAR